MEESRLMQRVLNATALNLIAEDPEVKPWIGQEDLDAPVILDPVAENPANFCFLSESGQGAYVVINKGGSLYEAHSLAIPAARGREMLRLMHDGFEFLFTATDCLEVTTFVPDGNEAAASWASIAGFRPSFRREAFFPLHGEKVGGWFMTLGYADWVMRAPGLITVGAGFHMDLEEFDRAETHPDDEAHDRWVGATIKGIVAGNIAKAIPLYNRWATVSGYRQAQIITLTPPLVDIGDAVIQMTDGELQFLKVRQSLS